MISCSKDESNPTLGSDPNAHESPPAGMTFPRIYNLTSRYKEYHCWINGFDRNMDYQEGFYFSPTNTTFDYKIRFISASKMEFLDSLGNEFEKPNQKYPACFRHDTMLLYSTVTIGGQTLPYEEPIGRGNFNKFSLEQSEFRIRLHHDGSIKSGDNFSEGLCTTKSLILLRYPSNWIMDTLAYRNIGFEFR